MNWSFSCIHSVVYIFMCFLYFMLLDELMMGCAQSRIGPLNLGWYGILSSLINGCNLIISQFLVPKLHFHLFQSFPMFFLLFSLSNYIILSPFFLVDVYLSLILSIMLSGLSMVFIMFCAYSGCTKYSILGSIRIISQFMSFELIFTTMILIFIWSFNSLSIGSMLFFMEHSASQQLLMTARVDYFSLLIQGLISVFSLFSNHLFLLLFFICILAESNSVPFDLPEAESELVAGFITEYSSLYFSLILLTEYANIIAMSFWMIILFSITPISLLLFLYFVCLIRSTLNRLKFDELMTNAWIVILPIMFSFLLLSLMV